MSSAIEVIKEMLEGEHCIYECCIGDPVKANAVKEALLALEQKEKLSKWLDDVEQNIKPTFEGTLEKTLYGKLVGTCKVREIMKLEGKS